MPIFMKWGDGKAIKGMVAETEHPDWIPVLTANFSTSRTCGLDVGSGKEKRHRDLPSFSNVQISRTVDKASPALFNQAVAGEPADVVLHFLSAPPGKASANRLVLEVFLKNCLIVNFAIGLTSDLHESFALNYTAITLEYKQYAVDGKYEGAHKGYFDLVTGQCADKKG